MKAMNRLLPALIFFVAGSLLILMLGKLGSFGPVQASERSDRVQVEIERSRFLSDRDALELGRETRPRTLLLRFSEAMVSKDQIGKRIATLPLEMDPPMALDGWWRSYDLLEVLPGRDFRRATRYRLHLDPQLESLSGLPVEASQPLIYNSLGLIWHHLGFVSDGDRVAPSRLASKGEPAEKRPGEEGPGEAPAEETVSMALRFDLALRRKDLEQHLTVLDRHEKPRRILGLSEAKGSLGKHWIVKVAKWEKEESKTRQGTRWFLVRLSQGLRPRGRELGLEEPETRSLRIGSNRVVLEAGKKQVRELFFRRARFYGGRIRLDFEREFGIPAAGQIEVDPAIPFQVHDSYRGIELVGDFVPGKTVEIRLAKGFPGFGRYRLPTELVRVLRAPDLPRSIDFSSSGRILSAKARPEIEVKVTNLTRCELSVRTLYPNNLVSFAHREDWDNAFGPWKTHEIKLSGPHNSMWHQRLSLASLLGKDTLGIHEVRITPLDDQGRSVWGGGHRILQVTDLGISVRLAKGQVALRVHGLAKGEPVAEATLRVMTPTNQVLVEGKTDAQGLALMSYTPGAKDRVPYVIEVTKGEDRSVLDFDAFGVELYQQGQGGRAYAGTSLEAWLHADRGIVRPGETLHLTGIVRDGQGRAPLGRKLRLDWKDPRGRVLARESIECSANGLIAVVLKTRPESATGNWSAQLSDENGVIGSTYFRVGAFVPARLEARVRPLEELRTGQPVAVQIEGNWLDGAPAEARRGKLKMRYDRARRTPKWLEGWTVIDGEVPSSPGAQKPVPFVLDQEGRAQLSIPIPNPRLGQQFLRASLLAELQDPSGRVVRATGRALVSPSDFVLAMRLVGKKAEIVLFDPEGKRLERTGKVELSLQRRRWVSKYRRRGRRWQYYSHVAKVQIQSLEKDLVAGRVVLDCSGYPKRYGHWMVLVAEFEGHRVVLPLAPRPLSPDQLRIQTPLAGVTPGEVADIGVDAPFAGKAFVTLEGDGIHAMHVVDLPAGHSSFGLEIPKGLTQPNIHIVANLTRSQAVNGIEAPYWCVGSSPLRLLHADRRSVVRVEMPHRIEPETEIEVTVRAQGASEAVLALVDEGILSITGHRRPDPLAFFLAQRRLEGEGMDTGLSLYGKPIFPKEIVEGGGGGIGARLNGTISGLIKPLALWSGRIALDASGAGKARFVVPQYEGRLRLVAVAAGTKKLGAASEPIIVRAPLSLRLALPRMLTPGDESRLVLHLRNQTGAKGTLRLQLEPKGGTRLMDPQVLARTWQLEDGEILDLSLPFIAGEVADQSSNAQGFRVHASLGGLDRYVDAVCLVRPMSVYTEDRRGIAIKGSKRLLIPGEWKGQGPKLTMRVSTRPDQRLLPILESLVRYPYGCLEQTLSKCWPLLSCQTLIPRLYPEGGGPEVDQLVAAAIRRILTMQTSNGAFALWPGGSREKPWLTVEALDFFLAAERMGFEVPVEARADLLGRVQHYLVDAGDADLRIRAAEVLARADKPVLSYLAFLGRRAVSRESRARLALTYAYLERNKEAREWLAKIAEGKAAVRQSHGPYATPVKDMALELRARLAIDPDADRVGVLLAKLGRLALEPRKLNTQEQGQVLRELASLYAFTMPGDQPPHVVVHVGDKKWTIQDEKSIHLDLTGHKEIRFESSGLCYAFLTLKGYRTDLEQQTMNAITLERTLYHPRVAGEIPSEAKVFKKGEVYEVLIQGKAGPGLRNLCLTDLLPGGFEFDGNLDRIRLEQATPAGFETWSAIDAREVRDDRLLLFLSNLPEGGFRIRYPVRAVSAGLYQQGLLQVESLYDPEGILRQRQEGKLRIED